MLTPVALLTRSTGMEGVRFLDSHTGSTHCRGNRTLTLCSLQTPQVLTHQIGLVVDYNEEFAS